MDSLGELGKYLVDYWVKPRIYAKAPLTGWGEEFEEEDKAIQLQKRQEGFIGLIWTDLDHMSFNLQQEQESIPTTKSYVFHVPITPVNYKTVPFDYQMVNQTSMVMVGGLIRFGRIYDQNKREAPEGTQQQHPESRKEESEERATLVKLMKVSEYKVIE